MTPDAFFAFSKPTGRIVIQKRAWLSQLPPPSLGLRIRARLVPRAAHLHGSPADFTLGEESGTKGLRGTGCRWEGLHLALADGEVLSFGAKSHGGFSNNSRGPIRSGSGLERLVTPAPPQRVVTTSINPILSALSEVPQQGFGAERPVLAPVNGVAPSASASARPPSQPPSVPSRGPSFQLEDAEFPPIAHPGPGQLTSDLLARLPGPDPSPAPPRPAPAPASFAALAAAIKDPSARPIQPQVPTPPFTVPG